MKNMEALFESNEKVWLYFPTEESKDAFWECASGRQLRFLNGAPVTREGIGSRMSLTKEGKMAHISIMSWNYGFSDLPEESLSENQRIFVRYPKVDFGKFVAGDGDCLMKRSPYRPAAQEDVAKALEKEGIDPAAAATAAPNVYCGPGKSVRVGDAPERAL